MSLKWKFYFAAALINIIGSAGLLTIGLYTDIQEHRFLNSFNDIITYLICLFFCLKSIMNMMLIKKYKANTFISKTTKAVFFILFYLNILIATLLFLGIIYSLSKVNSNHLRISSIIGLVVLFALFSTCTYCLFLDMPLLKKIDQQRALTKQLETIGAENFDPR